VEGGGDPRSCGFSVLIEQLNPYWVQSMTVNQGLTA
jgi:hypothetical protein